MTSPTGSARPFAALMTGVPLMILALLFQNVTVTSSTSYGPLLIMALLLTAGANLSFRRAFVHGGAAIRVASVVFALPTLFILSDFARRAPYVFS